MKTITFLVSFFAITSQASGFNSERFNGLYQLKTATGSYVKQKYSGDGTQIIRNEIAASDICGLKLDVHTNDAVPGIIYLEGASFNYGANSPFTMVEDSNKGYMNNGYTVNALEYAAAKIIPSKCSFAGSYTANSENKLTNKREVVSDMRARFHQSLVLKKEDGKNLVITAESNGTDDKYYGVGKVQCTYEKLPTEKLPD